MTTLKFKITIICLFTSITSFSQTDTSYKKLNELITNQRQEKSRNQKINEGIYLRQGFERYKGSIQLLGGDSSTIKYDEVEVHLYTERPEYKIIFEKGIFYPSVLNGNSSGGSWEKIKPEPSDSTSIFSAFSDYSIGVGVYDELKVKEDSYKTKRFRFWVFRKGLANPSEYIMDLENDSATESSDLKTFLINSKLTYIKFITIII